MGTGLRYLLLVTGLLALTGCFGPAEPIWATDEEVSRARYIHDGPPTVTLFTVINNRSGFGAHSALMVNGSERIIFDPAGTWHHPRLPERNDVHFGMTDAAVDFYVDYHSRITHHTVIQKVQVSEEVASMLKARMLAYGAVPKAECSRSVTEILSGVPGFETIPRTWFPRQVSNAFGKLPGAETEVVYDDDPANNTGVVPAPGV